MSSASVNPIPSEKELSTKNLQINHIKQYTSLSSDKHPNRRRFLGLLASTSLISVPGFQRLPGAVAEPSSFNDSSSSMMAMHVHGSWSEGLASWATQFTNAVQAGINTIYLTDHDHHALALGYLNSLAGAQWQQISLGELGQERAEAVGTGLELLVEGRFEPAAVSLTIAPRPTAFARLRTSIAGQRLRVSVQTMALQANARFEIGIALSLHPNFGSRPAGQLQLIYRFGDFAAEYFTEEFGRIGVITAPVPSAGSVLELALEQDVQQLWPEVLALDNSFYGLSFTATSAGPNSVADVRLTGVDFIRAENDPEGVRRNRSELVAYYRDQFPELSMRASFEYNPILEHMNAFGLDQYLPDYSVLTKDRLRRNQIISDDLHAQGALVSLNHPMGFQGGSVLPALEQTAKRRAVFRRLNSAACFGVDILEVGYAIRGRVTLQTHLELWDTFSRNGNFITGTGVNDDHNGSNWLTARNGYATGVWSSSSAEAEVLAALAAGRSYFLHLGLWPGGELDFVVDDFAVMGSVVLSQTATSILKIWVREPPTGSLLQIIAGPVDFANAADPGTVVVRTMTMAELAAQAGRVTIDSSSASFYRIQVITAGGEILGVSNPVWLLREQPPGGVPAARSPLAPL